MPATKQKGSAPDIPAFKQYAFNLSEAKHWKTLDARQKIPRGRKSKYAKKNRTSKVGLGIVETVALFLAGKFKAAFARPSGTAGHSYASKIKVEYTSNSGGSTRKMGSFEPSGNSTGREWAEAKDSMKGPIFLAILEIALNGGTGVFLESAERLRRLVRIMKSRVGMAGGQDGFSESELERAQRKREISGRMMGVCDSLYFEIKEAVGSGERVFEENVPPSKWGAGVRDVSTGELFEYLENGGLSPSASGVSAGTASQGKKEEDSSQEEDGAAAAGAGEEEDSRPSAARMPGLKGTLAAVAQTGGTALLVGPTGTLKTTTAKRAALESGAALTVLKGHSGVNTRKFFGQVMPAGKEGEEKESGEPQWVDGKLTAAMRKAREGKSVFLFDEVLRVEEYYTGALVGALDPSSPEEMSARGIEPTDGHEESDHYVLELPNGEQVAAPVENFALIATTNAGAEYSQIAGRRGAGGGGSVLGAALQARFELVLEVEEADPETKRSIYEEEGGSAAMANLLMDYERNLNAHSVHAGGSILTREANLRLMLNFAGQIRRLLSVVAQGEPEEGEEITRREAFKPCARQAAETTLVSALSERGPDGLIDKTGRDVVLDELESILDSL